MTEVLYRKYRPRNFNEVFGQEAIKKTLENSITHGNVAHAYLFSGPRGTGKTSLARIFAKLVNKVNDGDDSQLDIIEIDAASNRGIEEVRDLKQKINFSPSSLEYKVYIIDEVHMLTKEAFNALLKTLEEPPSHVIFILATTEINKVPLTVISRTQRFDFKLATKEEIIGKLEKILESEKIQIDKDGLELIAKLGKGSFRDTETILEKVIHSDNSKKITLDMVQKILGITSLDLIDDFIKAITENNIAEGFKVVSEIEKSGINIMYFYSQILEEFRSILVGSQTGKSKSNLSVNQLVKIISILIESSKQTRNSPIEILGLELALSQISEIMGGSSSTIERVPEPVKAIHRTVKKEEARQSTTQKAMQASDKKETEEEEEIVPKKEFNKDLNLTLSDVKQNWDKFLEILKPFNHHLVAFMKKSEPVKLEDGSLTLSVGYKFHKQRIEKKNSKDAIWTSFEKAIGTGLNVECILDESMKKEDFEALPADSNETIVEEVFGE